MQHSLQEIKGARAKCYPVSGAETDWLIAEVERLTAECKERVAEKMEWLGERNKLNVEVERLQVANGVLKCVDTAVRDYHYALDTRQHGGVAQDAAITAIEKALKLPWEPQKERKRREAVRP